MKNRKKRIVVFGLMFCFMLSLTACKGGVGEDAPLKGQKDSGTKRLEQNTDVIYCFDDSVIAVDGYQKDKVNAAVTEFALNLFKQDLIMETSGGAEGKNILISPASVISALGMTTFGANGATLSEMETMFGVSRGYLNHYNHQFLNSISDEMKIANSIWFTNDNSLTVKDEFLQFNEEFYGADVYETAFNAATVDSINNWVEQNTDGMIKDILDKVPADAVMYLINALVFEAEWAEKYESTQIWENREFTTSQGQKQKADMMCSDEGYYLEDDHAKGFVKYYKDQKYAFVGLLPEQGMSVLNYAKTLSGEKLQQMLANPIQTNVNVMIPQFSYEYDVEMQELLKEMGMTTAFDGGKADFTNMATSTEGNIYMNRVIHKTFIEVSPVGTKAGAATVVEMNCENAAEPLEQKEVYLDRPFLYMIIDCESNQPIFIGAVNSLE